ncbi:hypothetical protein R70006_05062 [Paraburkholderia domus]|uniref:hypothetical protein n=1 Tax=Paraburkholderia domus TaxID=2793075 RepID=UPI001911457C|nr:hypothetical protein [Paraburkholderia domus]MBK5051701.1 hypothetical protein [Burkholderia sp. R-70006]CAE6795683.1 hypothetical protein R70006_05062 [Paraburkholderia domus]
MNQSASCEAVESVCAELRELARKKFIESHPRKDSKTRRDIRGALGAGCSPHEISRALNMSACEPPYVTDYPRATIRSKVEEVRAFDQFSRQSRLLSKANRYGTHREKVMARKHCHELLRRCLVFDGLAVRVKRCSSAIGEQPA